MSDGAAALFATLNTPGAGGCVCCHARSQSPEAQYQLTKQSKAFASAVTGFDVGSDPLLLAAVTTEGTLHLLDAVTMRAKLTDKKAHMIFGTCAAFSGDGAALVTTSGDSSARVTDVPGMAAHKRGSAGTGWSPTGVVVLLVLAALSALAATLLATALQSGDFDLKAPEAVTKLAHKLSSVLGASSLHASSSAGGESEELPGHAEL